MLFVDTALLVVDIDVKVGGCDDDPFVGAMGFLVWASFVTSSIEGAEGDLVSDGSTGDSWLADEAIVLLGTAVGDSSYGSFRKTEVIAPLEGVGSTCARACLKVGVAGTVDCWEARRTEAGVSGKCWFQSWGATIKSE